MALDVEQVLGQAASSLQLCRVDSYDFAIGENGEDATDSLGNRVPTGLLNVTMLSREGTRGLVPFALPAVGNSAFIGTMPEIGAIGIVGFFEQEKPVIIGYLPPSLEGIMSGRGTVPALQPGEVFLQASTADVTAEGKNETFVGSSIKLDAYGRYILNVQDYKITIGYLFSDEYTPRVQAVLDSITGQAIYLEETLPGGTGRRVDNAGNSVWTYGKTKYERIGENQDVKVNGTSVSEARDGHVFKDRKNNRFGTDADGNFEANLATGGFTVDTQAGHVFKSGGPVVRQTLKSLRETVGGNYDFRAAIKSEVCAMENRFMVGLSPLLGGPATGISSLVVTGVIARTAALGMALTAGTVMTLIAPQVLIGPAPLPLVNYPGFAAVVTALIAAVQAVVGPVTFPTLAAVSGLLAAAQTTVVKGT